MSIRLNFWAPTAGFSIAYDGNLQPAFSAGDNQTYSYKVDYLTVRRITDPQTIIPTLPEWGVIILALAFVFVASRQLRRAGLSPMS